LAGARTVSVRSAFDDQSNRRIFKAPPLPPAANRDGSRSAHFKLTHYRELEQTFDDVFCSHAAGIFVIVCQPQIIT
jgi:hypothetical protein